jgi:hypothetical protein
MSNKTIIYNKKPRHQNNRQSFFQNKPIILIV